MSTTVSVPTGASSTTDVAFSSAATSSQAATSLAAGMQRLKLAAISGLGLRRSIGQ